MDAVTYPDAKVIDFVNENLVALRIPFNAEPHCSVFNVKWTPTLVTLDAEGKEHHRTVGFLASDELIASQLLGIGKTYFETGRFDQALDTLGKLVSDYPESGFAPEAVYLLGVCRYKSTNDPKPLKEAYKRLSAEYPSSEWTKRAYPYRLL